MNRRARYADSADFHKKIVMGPICPFSAHSIGSRDGKIPRYADTHACVRCVAALTEGRVSLDIHQIHREWRRRFMEFWTFVEVGDPEECWEWRGARYYGKDGRPRGSRHRMKRHWLSNTSTTVYYTAPRVACWFTWGDTGMLPVATTCESSMCCNPLHIRVLDVPHFSLHRKLGAINLRFDAMKLRSETLSFVELTKIRQPLRFKKLERVNRGWIDYVLRDSDVELPREDYPDELNHPSLIGIKPPPQTREHEPDPNLD